MREILFRGKLVNGGWIEGYLTEHQGGFSRIRPPYSAHENSTYRVGPETVGQYTGTIDKNGTKIFEGDIIKTSDFGVEDERAINHAGFDLFEVNFFDGAFRIENKWRLFNLRPSIKMEVVGNIYDNPELLKEVAEK